MSKDFSYYCRISIKEGLDIATKKQHLEQFIDERFFQEMWALLSTFYSY